MANETGIGHRRTAGHFGLAECCVWESLLSAWRTSQSPTWQWPLPIEGDRPVRRSASAADFSLESDCLGVQSKVWGKLLISLNMTLRPIANKYGDGRLKRTLKREFNSTWNCVVVNGGVLEVSVGNSALVSRGPVVSDQQWRCCLADVSLGCISPAVYGRNCSERTEGLGWSCWFCRQPWVSWLRTGQVRERTRIASNALLRFSSLCRVGRWPLRPVLKHGPRSLTCVRVIGLTKPKGVVKAKACLSGWGVIFRAQPRRFLLASPKGSSKSIPVRTRKMVNYAWPGWSQGKPWWRTVEILTCKSIFGAGYRGERLIEPSSSWFLPKFPSG